jgi:hypothetical protein
MDYVGDCSMSLGGSAPIIVTRKDKDSLPTSEDDEVGIFSPGFREKIGSDIRTFEDCYGSAMNNRTPAAVGRVREATDALMRALARMLIELERTSVNS